MIEKYFKYKLSTKIAGKMIKKARKSFKQNSGFTGDVKIAKTKSAQSRDG